MGYHYAREASYRVEPLTVRCGREEHVRILPLGRQAAFDDAREYRVTVIPMELQTPELYAWPVPYRQFTLRPENGILTVACTFPEEQEWTLLVVPADNPAQGALRFRIYSLEPDLYGLHPFRGDLHSHSSRSDGRDDPAVVAANYRANGFDFLALTDHHLWEPSGEAMEAYEGVPLDLKLFHGEEVHLREDYIIHIVNFGGEESVNAMYRADPEQAETEIARIAAEAALPYGVNPAEYARRVWITRRIRSVGGLAILAHPFWIVADRYNLNFRMLDYCMRSGIYDAMEIMTGQTVHENNLQLSFYMEERAKGVELPFVGSSDSHGTDPAYYFGMVKTVVLAESTEKQAIFDAIRNRRCAAVEQNPKEEYRVWGDFRMVKYIRFLLRCYFPLHDALCVEEGQLMKAFLLGEAGAADRLRACHGRGEALADRFLGSRAENP